MPQGLNTGGQLGDGSVVGRAVPTEVYFGGYWIIISAGYDHTCGIRADKSLW
jgi:hypothetical protein